jgi:hypothetical protein
MPSIAAGIALMPIAKMARFRVVPEMPARGVVAH